MDDAERYTCELLLTRLLRADANDHRDFGHELIPVPNRPAPGLQVESYPRGSVSESASRRDLAAWLLDRLPELLS